MKIAVLMSGGVDSSVVAALLLEKGYDVIGLTMVNWDTAAQAKAAMVAGFLGIEHNTVNLQNEFHDLVIKYFASSYEQGLTPNPCVECNKYIKFGLLLEAALQLNCDMVATGHYARVEYDGLRDRYLLKKGLDQSKDQSYFLYGLKQNQLSHALFPLGGITKQEVRQIAHKMNIPVADEGDSQEICFISNDYRDFLKNRVKFRPGLVVDMQGKVLGSHRGLPFYTIGQRRGLGISSAHPLYVLGLDMENNRLLAGSESDLYQKSLTAAANNFIAIHDLAEPMQVMAKVRYRTQESAAVISKAGNEVQVDFDVPQRAVAPGQSVVYYRNDCVVGGGVIIRAGCCAGWPDRSDG
jgi:tRNA-specific 2-thiouridylase